MQPEGLLP